MKNKLLGKTLKELEDICLELGIAKYKAKQIADWIYKKRVGNINSMSNLSLREREDLSEKYEVGFEQHKDSAVSKDGTIKYLYVYTEDSFVETVMIPQKERITLCISTQVGCKMACEFCATGKQRFQRNLSAQEIVNFVLSLPEYENLDNIVYMGMGEPFNNYNEVLKSIDILTSHWGIGMSGKRITVSTSGIIPIMKRFLEESSCHLAISMHNPFHSERLEIMPVEKAYPIEKVCDELRKYNWKRQRRLTFEYIVWKGNNDSFSHAKEIARLLDGIECMVNLIPYNSTPYSSLQGCNREEMELFQAYLERFNITTTIRVSKGEDILAACGLLSTKSLSAYSSSSNLL